MQTAIQVFDPADKQTSSWWAAIARTAIRLLVGVDAFKNAVKTTPDVRSGIALATNQTTDQLDTQLRLAGKDPGTYYDTLGHLITPGTVDSMSTTDINTSLAQADQAANDPSQHMWLWAAGGLLLLLAFGKGGRGRGRGRGRRIRGMRRGRSFRPRTRFHRRRFGRRR